MDTVCVIGAGPAGTVLALRLARRGVRVVVIESGPRYTPREKEAMFLDKMAGRGRANPYELKERRIELYRNAGEVELPLAFERLRGVGGTALHWGANTPRLLKADFKMRSTFGLADDWPIGYDDLEPFYAQAEAEIGVSGADDNPFAEYRSTPFPMPPIPFSWADKVLKRTTDRLGIEFHHTPQGRNSVPYGDRMQCLACALCEVCPIGARASFDQTHAAPAEATGRVRFVTNSTTLRLEHDASGRVRRAVYAGLDRVEHAQEADVFAVCCGAIETARLLLLSASRSFPDGLGNRSGLVGKNLMNHPIAQVSGRVDEDLYPFRVGFESTESFQYYATRTRDETPAFLMNMNNYGGTGPRPVDIAEENGLWGDRLAAAVRREFGHYFGLSAGVEQLPSEKNTVTLDPIGRDYFGQPVPLVTYGFDDYTARGLEAATRRQSEILEAAGARDIAVSPEPWWPGHHMGTTRMGDDPRRSVVDRYLRSHDVPNLYLVTMGGYVTGGVANPTLTLSALALRTAEHIAAGEGD
jgi:choline dehydrogenase-like flavoprotein